MIDNFINVLFFINDLQDLYRHYTTLIIIIIFIYKYNVYIRI